MARRLTVRLDDRERWFLTRLAGLVVGGKGTTVEALNRVALRIAGAHLRSLGYLAPYPKPLVEEVVEAAPAGYDGSPDKAESVRLGDDERVFLEHLKTLVLDNTDKTWTGLNRLTLRFAEDHLRGLGFLDAYDEPPGTASMKVRNGSAAGVSAGQKSSRNR